MSAPFVHGEVLDEFNRYFVDKHGYSVRPSSSLLGLADVFNADPVEALPLSLFASYGYQQNVIASKIVSCRKCLRQKYHNSSNLWQTHFSEILSAWSFGYEGKKKIVRTVWDLLTEVWNIDRARLYVTVFAGDEKLGVDWDRETYDAWVLETNIATDHIRVLNKQHSFWMLGDMGGSLSRILLDRSTEISGKNLTELGNLVFVQYDNSRKHSMMSPYYAASIRGLIPQPMLPQVPTLHGGVGLWLERICAVLQGKSSCYHTDLFMPVISVLKDICDINYTGNEGEIDSSLRYIVDIARTSMFAIVDGIVPSTDWKKGGIIRELMQKALVLSSRYFNMDKPFMHLLVAPLISIMQRRYPELESWLTGSIHYEEVNFYKLLDEVRREYGDMRDTTITAERLLELHKKRQVLPDLVEYVTMGNRIKLDIDGYKKLLNKD